jgi:hypothetical protein
MEEPERKPATARPSTVASRAYAHLRARWTEDFVYFRVGCPDVNLPRRSERSRRFARAYQASHCYSLADHMLGD